jgi:transcriptional regulator with XRE-family HTH domain
MDLRDVFASNLRRLRHAKGLSQDDLAYEAEVSRSYLSQLEKGAFYASLKIIGKLVDVLEVEPAEFLRLPPPRGPAALRTPQVTAKATARPRQGRRPSDHPQDPPPRRRTK